MFKIPSEKNSRFVLFYSPKAFDRMPSYVGLLVLSIAISISLLLPRYFSPSSIITPGLNINYHTLILLFTCICTLSSTNYKIQVGGLILSTLFLLQSFCMFYLPSLQSEIPLQDYLFPGNTSSNYGFDVAKIYVKNLALPFIAIIALFAATHKITRARCLRVLLFLFLLSFITNSLVILYQGLFDLRFLAQSSGSSISAGRAPGLLEDSAASNVFMAYFSSGFFAMIAFYCGSKYRKLILYGCFGLSLAAGWQCGGRLFFACTILPILITTSLRIKWNRAKLYKNWLPGLLALTLLTSIFLFMHKNSIFNIIDKAANPKYSDGTNPLINTVVNIDPNRYAHMKIMLLSFLEKPFTGTGLGSFFANFFWHVPKIGLDSAPLQVDLPSSTYLALISELGIPGIIIVGAVFIYYFRYWRLLKLKTRTISPDSFDHNISFFIFGATTALIISSFVGVHFYFDSISILLGASAAWIAWKLPPIFKDMQRKWKNLISAFLAILMIAPPAYSILKDFGTTMKVPEFQWERRGEPQVPASLAVPIVPHKGEGIWATNGAELLYHTEYLEVFIEKPPQYYPQKIKIEIIDQQGEVIETYVHTIEEYSLPKPGKLLRFRVSEQTKKQCLPRISRDFFCMFRLRSEPEWIYLNQNIAGFIGEEFLILRKSAEHRRAYLSLNQED